MGNITDAEMREYMRIALQADWKTIMMNTKKKEEKMDTSTKAVVTKNRFENVDVGIERHGSKITLPNDPVPMNYDEAISCIQRRQKEEETSVGVNEVINAFPFDGAHAFMMAMQRTYGWATPVPTEGFFGPTPPQTVNLEIDFGIETQIIWGSFKIPGIDGILKTSATRRDGRWVFQIGGEIKKKNQKEVAALSALTREILKTESVYKNKAIQLITDDDGDLDLDNPPKFLDLSRVNPEELVFSDEVAEQVQTSLFTPIEHTEACREAKIPLKRGVLLEGPFGTGKTLTAFVAATKCRRNGWTFIMIPRVDGLEAALEFARMYQPAVVFAEDVDRAVSGDRSIEMDDILNQIDGIESKGTEVMTVLTSNDVTSINRAMLRPGRLDAVIPIHAPDAAAVQKLIKLYARGLLTKGTSLVEAGKELAGQIPATVREVVERSKLYAIGRTGTSNVKLTGEDILKAAKGMKSHLKLLNGVGEIVKSPSEKFGEAFVDVVAQAQQNNGMYAKVNTMYDKLKNLN